MEIKYDKKMVVGASVGMAILLFVYGFIKWDFTYSFAEWDEIERGMFLFVFICVALVGALLPLLILEVPRTEKTETERVMSHTSSCKTNKPKVSKWRKHYSQLKKKYNR